jgi:cyclopropane fatty-acyl-phospholipid synthase-like methyltransferase
MQNSELAKTLFLDLESINTRPRPFEFYTASDLWTDEHTSARMLSFHLKEDVDISSRKLAFIDRSVEWLVRHLGIGPGVSVVDFGCGPGLYTSRLAKRGAEVTGIDFSPRSIEYARDQAGKLGLKIDYLNESYLDFTTDRRFDVLLMIFCDFCALSPAQRQIMLTTSRSILKPGGRIVLDVYSLTAFDRRSEMAGYEKNLLDGFWSPEYYYGFLNSFKYEEEKVSLDKYTIVEQSRTRTIYNWLQYFSEASLTREFRQAGLEIVELYSDVAGEPYDAKTAEFAVVAAKAQS